MIYLDNAATTIKKPQELGQAMIRGLEMGNSSRGLALEASRQILGARIKLADFFHLKDPRRVVFTKNSTEALNLAIHGLLGPGDHVITTYLEHNSVLRPLYQKAREGTGLSIAYPGGKGLGPADIEGLIGESTKALVISAASNLTGEITPLEEILKIAKNHGLITIVDGSQAAGLIDLDIDGLGIDALAITGHKSLYGPQGIGSLILNPSLDIRPSFSGGTGHDSFDRAQPASYPDRLEAGTLNGPGILGLMAGLDFVKKQGPENLRRQEVELLEYLEQGLTRIAGIKTYGQGGPDRLGILAFNLGHMDSQELADKLARNYGIITRPGYHCAPLVHQYYGTQDQGMVRVSLAHYNTMEEMDRLVQALEEISEESR